MYWKLEEKRKQSYSIISFILFGNMGSLLMCSLEIPSGTEKGSPLSFQTVQINWNIKKVLRK